MRESAVEFKYGKLIAGEVNYIHRVKVGAGEYNVGDILETTNGLTYAKATADAKLANEYAVVAEAVTLEAEGEVVCYKEGYFNKNVAKINDMTASDNSIEILKTKRIFITTVKED